MKFIHLLLPLLLAFSWKCTPSKDTSPDPIIPTELTYLALGDSYTIGQSVPVKARFPEQLADSLRLNGFDISKVTIIAKTGWTTDELMSGIDAANIEDSTYSLVSLLIGVNNQFRGRPVSDYKPEFEALLTKAIEFAGGNKDRVFVVSIPDYAFTPFGNENPSISAGIDEYNAANRVIAESFVVQYFDITPISREGLNDPALVAGDGLHPSEKQYAQWVSLMLPGVIELLK